MFAMNATAGMANTIAMVTMVQAVLDVDAESCKDRIRYGESSCVRTHLPVTASLGVKASVHALAATVMCLLEVICQLRQQ